MNNKGANTKKLIAGAAIGAALGATFVAAPVEIVVLAVPPSICVGIFLCLRDLTRLPAAGMTVAAVVSVIVAVIATRTDALDKRPASFSTNVVTIEDLVRKGTAYEPAEADWAKTQIRLASVEPTVREIIQAVNDQTPLRARVFRCGTGLSILHGAWVGKIEFRAKAPASLAATSKP